MSSIPLRWSGACRDLRQAAALPALLLWLAVFVAPVGMTFRRAFHGSGAPATDEFSHLAAEPVYARVLWNSTWIAGVVAVLCVGLGYAVAFLIVNGSRRTSAVCLGLVTSSLCLSVLVRSYAWTIVLGHQSVLTAAARALGLIGPDGSLLFRPAAVVIGMTHVLLPYAVLILCGGMQSAGSRLADAAASLGATRTYYILRVLLPATLHSVVAAGLLVFVLGVGFYITPELLGGGQGDTTMIASITERWMNGLGDWRRGAALSVTMVLVATFSCLSLALTPGVRRALAHAFQRTGGVTP